MLQKGCARMLPSGRLSGPELLGLFKIWVPLHRESIAAHTDSAPGVYLIREGPKVLYVGRADACLRSRLLQHTKRFPAAKVSVLYVKRDAARATYENVLINYLRRAHPLQNKIAAARRA